MSKIIMILYYGICLFLVFITVRNFVQEKNSRNNLILYLVTLIPFILRLLRIK